MERDMIAQVLGQLDHDAIVGLDGEDRIFFFDQGAETVSGYRAGDMIGRPVSTVLPVTARFVDAGEGTDPVGALWPLANDKPRRHSRAKGRLAP
jgi:PAS domain-containing protein